MSRRRAACIALLFLFCTIVAAAPIGTNVIRDGVATSTALSAWTLSGTPSPPVTTATQFGVSLFTGGTGDQASTWYVYARQTVAIADHAALIDAGKATLTLTTWAGLDMADKEQARLRVTPQTAAGSATGLTYTIDATDALFPGRTSFVLTSLSNTYLQRLPSGTRRLHVEMRFYHVTGGAAEGYLGNVEAVLWPGPAASGQQPYPEGRNLLWGGPASDVSRWPLKSGEGTFTTGVAVAGGTASVIRGGTSATPSVRYVLFDRRGLQATPALKLRLLATVGVGAGCGGVRVKASFVTTHLAALLGHPSMEVERKVASTGPTELVDIQTFLTLAAIPASPAETRIKVELEFLSPRNAACLVSSLGLYVGKPPATHTESRSLSKSATATPPASVSASGSRSLTGTATTSPTRSLSPWKTATTSALVTTTASATATGHSTATLSVPASPTTTQNRTVTHHLTRSATSLPTRTESRPLSTTASPSSTVVHTPSTSATSSWSTTASLSATASGSCPPTRTASVAAQRTSTRTVSGAPTATATTTASQLVSRSASIVASLTRSMTALPTMSGTATPNRTASMSATGTLDLTLTLSQGASATASLEPPRPPSLPARPSTTVIEASGGVASVAAVSGAQLAGPAAALQVARTLSIMSLANCAHDHVGAAPSFPEALVPGLHFGPAKGQHYRGAVVGNLVVIAAVFAIAAVIARVVIPAVRRRYDTVALARAQAMVRFPGLCFVGAAMGLEGCIANSVAAAFHGGGGAPWRVFDVSLCVVTAAAAVAFVGIASLAVMAWRSSEVTFDPSAPSVLAQMARDRRHRLPAPVVWALILLGRTIDGHGAWVPRLDARRSATQPFFRERWGVLFMKYGGHIPWAFAVEAAATVAVAVIRGTRPATPVLCRATLWATVAINAVMLAFAMARPYIGPGKNVLLFVGSAAAFGGAGLVAVGAQLDADAGTSNRGTAGRLFGAGEWLLLTAVYVALALVVVSAARRILELAMRRVSTAEVKRAATTAPMMHHVDEELREFAADTADTAKAELDFDFEFSDLSAAATPVEEGLPDPLEISLPPSDVDAGPTFGGPGDDDVYVDEPETAVLDVHAPVWGEARVVTQRTGEGQALFDGLRSMLARDTTPATEPRKPSPLGPATTHNPSFPADPASLLANLSFAAVNGSYPDLGAALLTPPRDAASIVSPTTIPQASGYTPPRFPATAGSDGALPSPLVDPSPSLPLAAALEEPSCSRSPDSVDLASRDGTSLGIPSPAPITSFDPTDPAGHDTDPLLDPPESPLDLTAGATPSGASPAPLPALEAATDATDRLELL